MMSSSSLKSIDNSRNSMPLSWCQRSLAHTSSHQSILKTETPISTLLCDHLIPVIAKEGLAEFCDAFVEQGAYTVEEGQKILGTAREHGLGIKLHADQLSAGWRRSTGSPGSVPYLLNILNTLMKKASQHCQEQALWRLVCQWLQWI